VPKPVSEDISHPPKHIGNKNKTTNNVLWPPACKVVKGRKVPPLPSHHTNKIPHQPILHMPQSNTRKKPTDTHPAYTAEGGKHYIPMTIEAAIGGT
jgi:hypothetical protein